MRKRFPYFAFFLLATLIAASFHQARPVTAQETDGRLVPALISPRGTLLDTTPTYKWSLVDSASNYHFQVYQESTLLVDTRLRANSCGISACAQTPAYSLGNKDYKWRVRARVNGMWMPWSKFVTFFVSAPSFFSGFNGSMAEWDRKGGIPWILFSNKIITNGKYMKWAHLSRTSGTYSDFRFSALIRRISPDGNSCLAYRMGTLLGNTYNDWYPGYLFCLGEDWQFTVIKYDSPNSYTTLRDFSPAASINVDDWNLLAVEARLDEYKFFINGVKVAVVEDNTYRSGYVGFSMFKTSTLPSAFKVEWAKLSVLETLP